MVNMGHSRLVADRMLLDLKALVLSLKFLRAAMAHNRSTDVDILLKSIRRDVERINRASHLIESFEVVYHSPGALKSIEKIIQLIENTQLEEADTEIKKLNYKLGAELSESFSSSASYPEIRPLSC